MPSIWRWYKTPGFKKAMDVYEESAEIIFRYVTQAREILKNRPKSTIDPDHEGVFEKLLKIDESVAVVMAAGKFLINFLIDLINLQINLFE